MEMKIRAVSGFFGCWRFEVGGKEAQYAEAISGFSDNVL